MSYRNIADARAYLEARMPHDAPRWLMERTAELLFRNPTWRLAEAEDVVVGQALNFVVMSEGQNMESSINFATKAKFDENPVRDSQHGKVVYWHNDHETIQCFGPLEDVLLMGGRMPDTCGEPHRIPMVQKADPERTLLEQLDEAFGDIGARDDRCPECGTIGRLGPSTLCGPGDTRYCYECCATR